jgi:diguanylate cyclase (GGDEF)-like protein
VIKEVAKRLSEGLRVYDGAGRYGGEEFLLILSGCDLDAAFRRAEEIKQFISGFHIATPAGMTSVTVSVGIAVASRFSARAPLLILEFADKALYRAKHNGRNRVEATALPEVST